ncbi:hypothetical protein [Streptomyces sp. NPDC086182]|jgi:hypothetical protein|uniref:TRAFAC clade GTPase domain-containing protein n=1 Tax=Streptomyces sp. NPDC086182 TaxID=3155058 RepID=UPI0034466F98
MAHAFWQNTPASNGRNRRVRLICPICLHDIRNWSTLPLAMLTDDGQEISLVRGPAEGAESWAQRLATAYRRCPGGDAGEPHFLPQAYGEYRRVVVGVIGASQAGKTHLLAAMIGHLLRSEARLRRIGLQVDPLDLRIHQRYMKQIVEPFLAHRRGLPATPREAIEFTDALKITNLRAGVRHAVSFFDVAGEMLERADDSARFLGAVDALLFVVDPTAIPRMTRRDVSTISDNAFDHVLSRLAGRPGAHGEFLPFPAAVVVAKADMLEFGAEPLPGYWLRRDRQEADEELDLSSVEGESSDAFAFLAGRRAEAWLRPAMRCYRSTLHFASATNSALSGDRYPELAFRQRRVLKPLLSLLAMADVLDHRLLRPGDDDAG